MSLRTLLTSGVAAYITSADRLESQRRRAEQKRRATGAPHVVDYFHQADDPYSHLMAQVLGDLARRYDIELCVHLVSAPADWAAPERDRLISWSRIDAACLARKASLRFVDTGRQPAADRIATAESLLAASLSTLDFVTRAPAIGEALWTDTAFASDLSAADPSTLAAAKASGDALRSRLGHYLGGTLHYAGEWYWGLDRLHFLEERLAALGARKADAPARPIFAPPVAPACSGRLSGAPPLEYFLSFRSPYTYIVADRARLLAEAYGVELKLRMVLPMVMRGLPVPRAKSQYIILDTAREARRLGVPFGRVADPVGKPVERGYAILHWAIGQGRGFDFAISFMRGVWSEGIDAGSDAGMRTITERAGLDWSKARDQLKGAAWRTEAEANRTIMMNLGLWGVPCFRFGDVAVWGQDRLWVIEDAMRARLDKTSTEASHAGA